VTVYWVVWDSAAQWIVDRLDREGALPAVRRLRATGITAAARPPSPNCQTPPSLATLFTGTWSHQHAITGFTVPGGPEDPVECHRSGFGPRLPAQPPVWRRAQALGLRTTFVHTPWVFDADGAVDPGVVAAVEAYSTRICESGILPLAGSPSQEWPAGDEAVDVSATATGVRLVTGTGTHDLHPARGWAPVRLTGTAGFWARYLDLPSGPAVVRTGTWAPRAAGEDTQLVRGLADAEVFAGEGLKSLYRSGRLGPRLADGGDGGAERVFVSSLDCVARSFGAAADVVLPRHRSDLVVIYLPLTDDVGHELVGWCDTASAMYRPDVADAVWGHVRHCYARVDAILSRVLDHAHDGDTVILGADHGIVGSAYLVALNMPLIKAGLAVAAPGGGLDARRSSVIYHPANNGALRVNHDGLPGGLVPRARAGETLRAAMAALLTIAPPTATGSAHTAGAPPGRPVVTGFMDAAGRQLPPSRVGATDDVAYVVLHDDYQPTAEVDGGPAVRPMAKSAAHVVNTGTDRLHATFAAVGPGLPAGVDLGVVDNTFGAGLVSRLLGFDESGAGSGATMPMPTPKGTVR
jgi:hypothetical protein